jgi:hypothetical protein
MNKLEIFEEKLSSDGISVIWEKPSSQSGAYVKGANGKSYIFVSPHLTSSEKMSVLCHEAGHHYCDFTGLNSKDELRATKWASLQLLKISDLISAIKRGCRSYYELSEYLSLDEAFLKTAVALYATTYGEQIEYGNYTLHLLPLWVMDKETGQVWPEE